MNELSDRTRTDGSTNSDFSRTMRTMIATAAMSSEDERCSAGRDGLSFSRR